jgi:hypothetical protein
MHGALSRPKPSPACSGEKPWAPCTNYVKKKNPTITAK